MIDLLEAEITNLNLSLRGLIVNSDSSIIKMEAIKNAIIYTKDHGGKVIFTGIGKNVYAAQKLAASYSSIGIPSFFMDAVHAVHGDLGVLSSNDLLICMSKSGNTAELINTLKYIKSKPSKFPFNVVGIDCHLSENKNGFDEYCDLVLHVNTFNEIDKLNLVPTVSLIVLQIIGDVIGVKAAEEIGFNKEIFKANHPGGSIGEQLSK